MLLVQREFGQLLQNSSVGTISVDIFLGQLPRTPVDAIGVKATGGESDRNAPLELRRATVQILCRGASYEAAAVKAESVYHTVAGKWNALPTLKGYIYPEHPVGPSFRDANNDFVFTLNFGIATVSTTI